MFYRAVVSGGARGALAPPEFEVLLTLFQPEGADYAHHITASTLGFENLTTSLQEIAMNRYIYLETTNSFPYISLYVYFIYE